MNLKKIGIYKITNPNNKIYIGQSIDLIARLAKYRDLSSSVKKQKRLWNSLIKYGSKNHTFEIIEECEIDRLNIRERYWQDHYDVTSRNGLNCFLTLLSDKSGSVSEETKERMRLGKLGFKHSEESKKKMSIGRMGDKNPRKWSKKNYKKVYQYSINKTLIQSWPSVKFVANQLKITESTISNSIAGNKKDLISLGNNFYWSRKGGINE